MLGVFKRIANRSAVGAVAFYDAVTGTGQYAPKKKGSKKKGRKRNPKKRSFLLEQRERARRRGAQNDTDPPASDDEDDDPYGAEAAPDDPLPPPPPEPEWPNVDVDDIPDLPPPQPIPPREPDPPPWPDYDVDDYAPRSEHQPPNQSLPHGHDHEPPPRERPARPHRRPTTPPRTSTSTGGPTVTVSPDKYRELVTTAPSRAGGWQAAADAARRDSADFTEEAKKHDAAAAVFKQSANLAAAEESEDMARQLREDANRCLVYAAEFQEHANAGGSKVA